MHGGWAQRVALEPRGVEACLGLTHCLATPVPILTSRVDRASQFNGLQTYLNWNVTTPDPAKIAVEKICYEGLLRVNVSCKAPPPSAP